MQTFGANKSMQNTIVRILQTAFGVPWLVFGAQHFLFASFVAALVPAFFPARWFWAYATGAAMIAAAISLITGIKARLAAVLLGAMLLMFFLLIQVPKLAAGDWATVSWTRVLQDFAIASGAFVLAGFLPKGNTEADVTDKMARLSRYALAVLLIVFGIQQFLNLDFLTAKVAPFLPLRIFWVYLTGAAMIITGLCVLTNKKARLAAFALGGWMLILNLLLHAFLLVNAPRVPLLWTAAMLDLAITCGVFILAVASPPETAEVEIEIDGDQAKAPLAPNY